MSSDYPPGTESPGRPAESPDPRSDASSGLAASVSLETRLVATIVLAVTFAMAVFGGGVLLVLREYLVRELDEQLRANARAVAQVTLGDMPLGRPGPGQQLWPTEYAVLLYLDGETEPRIVNQVRDEQPTLDQLAVGSAEALASGGNPYTVPSVDSTTRWRVVTLPLRDRGRGPVGSVSVALPLDVDNTVNRLAVLAGFIGLGVVVSAAFVGRSAVRRSLRPLHDVELTAAAIAAGDLSRRVPADGQDTEVGRLTRALNGMLTRIEESIRLRDASQQRMRRFVSDASHELRTPLASIRGFAELRRQGAVPDSEVDATFDRIEREARRLGVLVDDLLLLAKLDERRPMRRDRVNLTALVRDAGTDARALDPERSVRVTDLSGGEPGAAEVVGDGDRLRQVLANLIGNAVRHTPAGTALELRVGTEPSEAAAVVEIVDHGPGIPEVDRARVFERFARLDASRHRRSGGGAGLGLSIVAAVVEGHGGSASVIDTPGGGATFRVLLPSADATPAPPPEAADSP